MVSVRRPEVLQLFFGLHLTTQSGSCTAPRIWRTDRPPWLDLRTLPRGRTREVVQDDQATRASGAADRPDSLLALRARHGRGSARAGKRGDSPAPSRTFGPALPGAAPQPASDQGRAAGEGLARSLG